MQTSRKAKAPSAATPEASIINPVTKGTNLMKNDISVLNKSQLTMSSLEIAELVGSRHVDVKRSIERLIEKGTIRDTPMAFSENINNLGFKTRQEYYLFKGEQGKRDSIIVIAQLCPEFTARIVDRWQELEEQVNSNSPILPDFNDPVKAARAWADEREQTILLTHKVEELEPKAEFHDKVTSSKDAISLAQAAKTLGTGRNRLCALLRQNKWLRRNNEPYQDKIEQGLLDVKLTNWEHPDNGLQQSVTALVTGKGLTKISQMLTAH